MDTATPLPPNHHAHHPGFSGISGLAQAFMFAANRDDGARAAADMVGLGPNDVLVDIGAGAGNGVRAAVRRGASAIGVEPSAEMRRVAGWLTRSRRASYRAGGAEHVPVDDDAATVVWSIACVHHWHDLDAGLREVRRILRPGGRFLAVERRTEPGADGLASHGWTDAQAEAFADRCRTLGFADVTVREIERRGAGLAVFARQSPK